MAGGQGGGGSAFVSAYHHLHGPQTGDERLVSQSDSDKNSASRWVFWGGRI